jgi:hypothetical protein
VSVVTRFSGGSSIVGLFLDIVAETLRILGTGSPFLPKIVQKVDGWFEGPSQGSSRVELHF